VKEFFMNEGSVELPAGFVDRTVHILEWSDAQEKQTMLVQREPLPEGTPLADFVTHTLGELASAMQHFTLGTRRILMGTRFPTEITSFRWMGEAGLVAQAQTFTQMDGVVLIQTMTTAPADRARGEELVERAARSLKPRRQQAHSDLPFAPASSAPPSSVAPPSAPPAEMGTGTL
jgi:hypothetical protein